MLNNGMIVLAEEDVTAYTSGILHFYNINDIPAVN